MSTIYTIEIQGSKTNLLTENADYDYEYDSPNFKFTFQSGASESATHINPAIDQNSISTIGEECSIINGGAVSSMTSTPTVTLTGSELMAFIKANGINLVNCSIVINATIDTVTSTLFTGVTSSVEYVDAITIRLKSIEDGLSIDDAPILTLSEDSAPGIDPTLYGTTVPVVIGDNALVKLYPIDDLVSSPSIYSLRSEIHLEDATQQPYIFDADGNPGMKKSSAIVFLTNNRSGDNNPLEFTTIVGEGLFLHDATTYYAGYEIEIISGTGSGNRYGMSYVDGNEIRLDRRLPDDELTAIGLINTQFAPQASWPETAYATAIVSIDRNSESNVTSIMVAGKGSRVDDSDYPGSNSSISYFRFVPKSAQFYFANPTINQTIDGYPDALTCTSLWTKNTGYISDISSSIISSNELSIVQINAKREGESLLIDKQIPTYFYCSKRSGVSDQTGNEISTSSTSTYSTTPFFGPQYMPNNGTLIPFGVRTNIFNGSNVKSPDDAPYQQSVRYMIYSKVDTALNDIDLSSVKAILKHNLKVNVTSVAPNFMVGTPSLTASMSLHIVGEDMISSGYKYSQSQNLLVTPGASVAIEIDSINGVYSNQKCRDFGSSLNAIDISSMISSMSKTGVKYIVCFYEIKYDLESVLAGDYITVDIAGPQLTASIPVSINDLYCTLSQPTGSYDIISASDIVRLSLLSADQTIDEASFANARASMPSATSPSISIDDGDLSNLISDVCKWSGMSLIKDRLGTYNARWWLNDESGASPSRTFTHADIAEKSGIEITKDSTGFAYSKFGFTVSDGLGVTSSLVVNPGAVTEFPASTAWTRGAEKFRQHTGDTRTWMGLYNGYNYYLYKSGETQPLTPRNPFIKGAIYACYLFGQWNYFKLIDFSLSSTGKTDIIFRTEQGLFADVIVPGNAFYLARSQPDWKYLVSGSGVTSLDYQTARTIWTLARNSRASIGKTIALPSDISQISQNIFGSNVSTYINQIVNHCSRQKQLIDFEVKLNTQNLGIKLLDWVAIEAGPFVAYPITGWVINVNLNPGAGTIGITVMAFDQDFSGNFVINENHTQGLSAPIVITEATPSTNIFSEA